jgi:hypothetical protein
MRTINKVQALVRNFIWLGKDGESQCRAKVAWSSMILPKEVGGLKLLDPVLKIKAFLAKLFIRGLMPCVSPWKTMIEFRICSLRPKHCSQWLGHIHFILFATNAWGCGSEIWWGTRKALVDVWNQLIFQQPQNSDTIGSGRSLSNEVQNHVRPK